MTREIEPLGKVYVIVNAWTGEPINLGIAYGNCIQCYKSKSDAEDIIAKFGDPDIGYGIGEFVFRPGQTCRAYWVDEMGVLG